MNHSLLSSPSSMAWREALKKPVAKPTAPKPKFETKDDDWDTDINYENISTEKAQRFGSTSVPGTGRIDHVDFKSIQEKMRSADETVRQVYQEKNPNRGYGESSATDQVMDKSAADFSYQANVPKHSSQTDGTKGFGGTYGVDERPKDKSAVGFDYRAPVEKHSSQTDFSKGFGGKYGKDTHAQDKSAVDFSHQESLSKHPSQQDYSVGFGGKYGVQKEEPSRLNARAASPNEPKVIEKPLPPMGGSAGVGNIRARFENMKKEQEEEAAKRVAEERQKRTTGEQQAQQKPASNGNGHSAVKPQEIPSVPKEPVRAPSPTPPPAPAPAPQQTIYENFADHYQNHPSTSVNEEKQAEPVKIIGGINVSSLLRSRKASSSSKNEDDDEDEWAADHHHAHEQPSVRPRSPSPTPAAHSQKSPDAHQHEGVRCVAHYSYQKTEDDELGFEENEIITNVQKMHDEWWFGKIGPRSGLFPANYVEELP